MQEVVGSKAVPLAVEQDGPDKIGLVYPSADVSDFRARAYLAFTKRIYELGIEYETTEFASRQSDFTKFAPIAMEFGAGLPSKAARSRSRSIPKGVSNWLVSGIPRFLSRPSTGVRAGLKSYWRTLIA